MHPGVLRALEFDRIVEAVAGFALTPLGDERLGAARSRRPIRRTSRQLLAATTEDGHAISQRNGAVPAARGGRSAAACSTALAVEGRRARAAAAAGARRRSSIRSTRRAPAIRRVAGSFPLLEAGERRRRVVQGRDRADARARSTRPARCVDHASPELKIIRERLRKQRTRLRGTLESYLRGKDTAKYLQDQVVTERNGRYVLVVQGRAPQQRFPASCTAARRAARACSSSRSARSRSTTTSSRSRSRKREEVRRILLALTDAFRARAARPAADDRGGDRARRAAGARALLASRSTASSRRCRPTARSSCRRRGIRCSKQPGAGHDQDHSAGDACCSITGPNTGGKTVALKTAGLLALMAQAGLHIPAADGSRLPVFRSIFADIGDEQSIEASLSTFSGAHHQHRVDGSRRWSTPALVLLDEVGSGTDPIEGGALGVAIVDHFRQRGATVIATSHYDALKTYASTTEGVASAAFGFDAETFAPTYQLIYGSPGRSLALEIAARLGLNPSVIAAARAEPQRARGAARRAPGEDRPRHARARARAAARRARARDARSGRGADAPARGGAAAARGDVPPPAERGARDQVRQARREIDEVIAELKAKTAAHRRRQAARRRCRPARPARRAATRARPSTPSSKRILDAEPARQPQPTAGRRDRAPQRRRSRHRRRARPRRRRHGDSRRHGGGRRARQADARQRPRPAGRRRAAPSGAGAGQRARRAAAARDDAAGPERDRLHAWTRRSRGPSGFSTSRC